jgi:transposase
MWDAYQEAAAEKLPNARRVIDHFHVMKNLTEAITKARRIIQRDADDATKDLLKGCRWLLVKNRENLTNEEEQKLTWMLAASPELATCYQLKEDFRALFNQTIPKEEAQTQLEQWMTNVQATPFKALQKFVGTLRNWWHQILNYFVDRANNGFAEGVNLKIKMLNRRGFGYRNFK